MTVINLDNIIGRTYLLEPEKKGIELDSKLWNWLKTSSKKQLTIQQSENSVVPMITNLLKR